MKKQRSREYKRLLKCGWPYYLASRGAKHGLDSALCYYGWQNLDDMTPFRDAYYNKGTDEVLYRYEDDSFEVFCINGKPLYNYYD